VRFNGFFFYSTSPSRFEKRVAQQTRRTNTGVLKWAGSLGPPTPNRTPVGDAQ
jgi:hypothetical protein